MKNEYELLSNFFCERLMTINIPKIKQKDVNIIINHAKPKTTFTNLIPLPNSEENVLPKNSPEIALKNLKAKIKD